MTRWTIRTGLVLQVMARLHLEAGWAAWGATRVQWRIDRTGRHIADIDAPEGFGALSGAERVGVLTAPTEWD